MPRQRARGRDASRRDPLPATAQQAPWSEFCILFRGNHQSRALEKALQLLRMPVPPERRHRVPRPRRGEGRAVVAAPDRQSRRRRGVPARGAVAQARGRRDHAGEARRTGAARRHCRCRARPSRIGVLKQLPPRAANALSGFVDIVRDLRGEAAQLPPARAGARARRDAPACSPRCARSARTEATVPRSAAAISTNWPTGSSVRARTVAAAGELAAQLALLSHADKDDAGNQVRLMSLHGAKGLEFRYVFIVGVRGRHPAARGEPRRRPPRRGTAPALRRHHPRQGAAVAVAFARGAALGRARCA